MSAQETGDDQPPTAQVAFDAFMRDHIRPALSAHGFRRSGATFHRAAGANWEVINVQRSYHSDRERITFTINLAVGFEALRAADDSWPEGKRPAEFRCHLRARLNQLIHEWDLWWELGPTDPLGPLAAEVVGAIEQAGLPWLDARSDELRWRDASLASLREASWPELLTLERLLEILGPQESIVAVQAERSRRP